MSDEAREFFQPGYGCAFDWLALDVQDDHGGDKS